jgi:MarR-like DNA-binding transcriptional regulator SgrR of sgrS sRNA
VETAAAMRSLNPASAPLDQADAAARRWLQPLVFETLVAPGPAGGLLPVIATEWDSDPSATRWRFRLRSNVKLHDGSALDAGRVAAALRAHGRPWTIAPDTTSVTIETAESSPDLPWELADSRYAIAFARPEGGEPIGTGPFAIERWEPRRLRLRAHEDHWQGRPFVDSVQVEMARPLNDQIASLDLGRADMISVQPQDVRRVMQRGRRLAASRPLVLVALVFEGRGRTTEFRPVRQALSRAIDRASMSDVLLQRQAQPAWTIVPEWIGGYSALLTGSYDRTLARRAVVLLPSRNRMLTLAIDGTDAMLRTIAERVVVDAADAGFSMTLALPRTPAVKSPDARLVAVRLDAATREQALMRAVSALGPQARVPVLSQLGDSLEAAYRFERALRDEDLVVPLVHVSELLVSSASVGTGYEPAVLPTGAWNLAVAWLKGSQP